MNEAATKTRAPTLYVIIAIKLLKGLLFLGIALGIYSLWDNDLPADFKKLLESLHFDPEREFFSAMFAKIRRITPQNILWVASGTLFYSLLSIAEGIGLIFRVAWVGWVVVVESLFFIPIEMFELIRGFSATVFIILLINVWIVWYLVRNRHRLFKHHSGGDA
jgi:uncharacterized membrane protein (DUF2068 family)